MNPGLLRRAPGVVIGNDRKLRRKLTTGGHADDPLRWRRRAGFVYEERPGDAICTKEMTTTDRLGGDYPK